MKDRLDIINQRVEESGVSKADIATLLNVNRGTIYNWLVNPSINRDQIVLLGYAIQYDFSKDFSDLKGFRFFIDNKPHTVGEPGEPYQNHSAEKPDRTEKRLSAMEKEMKQMNNKLQILTDTLSRAIKLIS